MSHPELMKELHRLLDYLFDDEPKKSKDAGAGKT
jgi:hypothetical protein